MVRLVKGAYWDTEIKRAQERGLADYPVFTRKAMTDLCYLDCARKLLGGAAASLSAIRHPQRAHGGERDRGRRRHRGLRIPAPARHGRGALSTRCLPKCRTPPAASMRRSAAMPICSPIWCAGCWRTAPIPPSSRSAADPACRSKTILKRPQSWIGEPARARHPPYSAAARSVRAGAANSRRRRVRRPRERSTRCSREIRAAPRTPMPTPLIDGVAVAGHRAQRASRRSTARRSAA